MSPDWYSHSCHAHCCSIAKSCLTICDLMDCSRPDVPVLRYLPEFAQTHINCRWCHPTNSCSVIPSSFCLQSFPASGSLPMSQLFASRGQSFWASAWALVLAMNIQGWFPLALTGLLSFCLKDSQESSLAPQFESINSSVLSLVYGPTLLEVRQIRCVAKIKI